MKTLNAELAARGRKIDYVLVSHTEPDHSGARLALVECSLGGGQRQSLGRSHRWWQQQ